MVHFHGTLSGGVALIVSELPRLFGVEFMTVLRSTGELGREHEVTISLPASSPLLLLLLLATNDSLIDYCGVVAEINDLPRPSVRLHLLDAERKSLLDLSLLGRCRSATAKCEEDDDDLSPSISRFRRPRPSVPFYGRKVCLTASSIYLWK